MNQKGIEAASMTMWIFLALGVVESEVFEH
jgi:hypothetical protein